MALQIGNLQLAKIDIEKYEILSIPASLMMVIVTACIVVGFIAGPIAWRNGYKHAQLDAMNAEILLLEKETEENMKEIESNEQKLFGQYYENCSHGTHL